MHVFSVEQRVTLLYGCGIPTAAWCFKPFYHPTLIPSSFSPKNSAQFKRGLPSAVLNGPVPLEQHLAEAEYP